MSRLKTFFRELFGCLRWTAGTAEAMRLFVSLLRFHLAEKCDRRDVTTSIRIKNPLSKVSWQMRLRVYSGDLFILTEVFFDECYKLPPAALLSHPGQPPRILDLGGNIGLLRVIFSLHSPRRKFAQWSRTGKILHFFKQTSRNLPHEPERFARRWERIRAGLHCVRPVPHTASQWICGTVREM